MNTKMNPEVKTKWLEALRSGEYKQGTEALRKGDSFCCLGVLTDIYIKETGDYWDDPVDARQNSFNCEEAVLVGEVIEWSGLPDSNPDIPALLSSEESTLADLNDNGATFKQIADIIEAVY